MSSNGRLAIRLRGVVKRYGPITAVDGLDLDVPEATCVGLLGPNGAGKSTTMRMLTAQAIADEGELELLGFKLPRRVEAGAGAARRRAAARQPRRDADRRAEPARLRLPLPHRPARTARGGRARDHAREPRRPARHAGRQAVRGHASPAADRPRARASPAAGADGRADGRSRSAGAPGALGADRRAARRGHDDPDVDALHRGGAAPRRHGAHHVARQGRRPRAARSADRRVRRQHGARGLRAAAAPRRGRGGSARVRPAEPAHGHERGDPRRRRRLRGRAAARRTSRTCSCC